MALSLLGYFGGSENRIYSGFGQFNYSIRQSGCSRYENIQPRRFLLAILDQLCKLFMLTTEGGILAKIHLPDTYLEKHGLSAFPGSSARDRLLPRATPSTGSRN